MIATVPALHPADYPTALLLREGEEIIIRQLFDTNPKLIRQVVFVVRNEKES